MSTVGVPAAPNKPPDVTIPGTINVYAATVWLQSEQPHSPTGRSIVVAAPDIDTARQFVSNFYGADLINWSGPTQMIHDAFLSLADGTGIAAPDTYEQRHLHQHEEPAPAPTPQKQPPPPPAHTPTHTPPHAPTTHTPTHDVPEPPKHPPGKHEEHEQKAAAGKRR